MPPDVGWTVVVEVDVAALPTGVELPELVTAVVVDPEPDEPEAALGVVLLPLFPHAASSDPTDPVAMIPPVT